MRVHITSGSSLLRIGAILLLVGPGFAGPARGGEAKGANDEIVRGKELFFREWLPDDPRSHRGAGLGPVYNDSSCIACHNMGAPGGAGPSSKDVLLVSAIESRRRGLGATVISAVGQALLG